MLIWVPLAPFLHVSFPNCWPSSLLRKQTYYMALPNKWTEQKRVQLQIIRYKNLADSKKGLSSHGATGRMLHFNVRKTNCLLNMSFGIGLEKVYKSFHVHMRMWGLWMRPGWPASTPLEFSSGKRSSTSWTDFLGEPFVGHWQFAYICMTFRFLFWIRNDFLIISVAFYSCSAFTRIDPSRYFGYVRVTDLSLGAH